MEGDEIVYELNVYRGGGEMSNVFLVLDFDVCMCVNCVELYKNGFIIVGFLGDVVIVD